MEQVIKWFTPYLLLTFNCLFHFIIGDRGGGKSFGTLEFCIKQFLKHGKQFIYLRRYETELDDTLPSLFKDMIKYEKFPDHELTVNGKNLYCDGKQMGYGVALSTSMKKKSKPMPDVAYIIFEEFMVDGVSSRYIGQGDFEVTLWNNYYETVDRLRDVTRVFFIGNAFSMVNIYFMYYKIRLKAPYKTFNKIGNNMVCIWQDESYREAKKKTRFYDIVKDSEFAQHAYENKFILDSDKFIQKKSNTSQFHFAFHYMNKTYGVWVDWNNGKYYITTKLGSTNPGNIIALTLNDNTPNNVNIRRVKNMPFIKAFRRAVDENSVYYDQMETYAMLNEVVYLLRTIT